MTNIKNLIIIITIFIANTFQLNAQSKLKPSLDLNGYIQYSFEFHSMGDSTYAGNEFRKMVINAAGKIYKNVSYVAQFDFADGTVGMRDIYIMFNSIPIIGGNILFGVYHESTGLDIFTSSKFKTFAERPIILKRIRITPEIFMR